MDRAKLAKESVTGIDGQADSALRSVDNRVCSENGAYHESDNRVDREAEEEA